MQGVHMFRALKAVFCDQTVHVTLIGCIVLTVFYLICLEVYA